MNLHSLFDNALLAEREGRYHEALTMFLSCLTEDDHDEGEVLFHCGWCTEQEGGDKSDHALQFYELAATQSRQPECKLNSFFRAGWLLMQQKEHAKGAIMFRHAIDYGDLSYYKNDTYHQSAFWYAVCVESQGWYIEAIRWYRLVRILSQKLDPECRLRELSCLNQIGSYDEAYNLCQTFDEPPPAGFEANRYHEIRTAVLREREMLHHCLSERPILQEHPVNHGSR